MKADPLQRLTGMRLVQVDEADETVGLRFDGCMLRGFTPHLASTPLEALVGSSVVSVSVQPSRELAIHFGGGGRVTISLAPADYAGPEAFVASFSDGSHVVE